MRINTKQLILLAQRYRVSVNDLAEMLCVYPERIRELMKQSVLELDEDQATNLVKWFGVRDALAMMELNQRRAVMAVAMA